MPCCGRRSSEVLMSRGIEQVTLFVALLLAWILIDQVKQHRRRNSETKRPDEESTRKVS